MKAKKKLSQKRLVALTNIIPNNPEHKDEQDDNEDLGLTLYDETHNNYVWRRIREAYKSKYGFYNTYGGHYKERDEPPEGIQIRQAARIIAKTDKDKSQISKDRLKKKMAVPRKNGQPMWEESCLLDEDINRFAINLKSMYNSGTRMRFRDWLAAVDHLLETL
jgi:hypothetical protein